MNRVNRQPLYHTVLACLLSAVAWTSSAETIKIPVGQQGASQTVVTPRSGTPMDQVLSQFGEPQTRYPARGEPPISRWEFERFVVYFENEAVIHTVIKPQKSAQ